MVGIRSFPFGFRPIFRGRLLVSGSVGGFGEDEWHVSQGPFLGSDFMFDVGSMKSISRKTEGTCIGSIMCAYINTHIYT